jgi:hypothetical protein
MDCELKRENAKQKTARKRKDQTRREIFHVDAVKGGAAIYAHAL